MGRIKSALIKRTAKTLVSSSSLEDDFNKNKKLLEGTMPNKRMRNMIAGYITRLEKRKKKREAELNPKA